MLVVVMTIRAMGMVVCAANVDMGTHVVIGRVLPFMAMGKTYKLGC
jgi:hypothetical protein